MAKVNKSLNSKKLIRSALSKFSANAGKYAIIIMGTCSYSFILFTVHNSSFIEDIKEEVLLYHCVIIMKLYCAYTN